MSKKVEIWLIVATVLILVGALLFAGIMMSLGWDFTKLSTVDFEINQYEVVQKYESINITTITSDVMIILSEDNDTRVDCFEKEYLKHTVEVINGTLNIEVVDTRDWYNHLDINFHKPRIKVYIPRGEYNNLSIKATTGDITICEELAFRNIDVSLTTGDISCGASATNNIKLKSTTGDVRLEGLRAWNIEASLSTGDISLRNVVATGELYVTGTTGNIRLDECDATWTRIRLSTGNVKGSFLTPKIITAKTTTGSVDVPQSTTGGLCEITTTTGNIKITIK